MGPRWRMSPTFTRTWALIYAYHNISKLNNTPPSTMTLPRLTIKDQKVGRSPTLGNLWPLPNIIGVILPFIQFSPIQLLSHLQLFETPRTAARQASPSITNFQSLLTLMSIELAIPSNHFILSSFSPPARNLFQHQGLFKWVSSSHQVAKVLELFQLQHQSFQWTPRTDLL